jgi:NTP pyrophosphatase (non-canonical NTP hydrolase)
MFGKLPIVSKGMQRRFPDGFEPFQIMTRLLEECGELAQEVNHFEGSGIKRQKYGEPDKTHLAHELMQVLRCAYEIAIYYGIEPELDVELEQAYQRLKAEGHIHPDERIAQEP